MSERQPHPFDPSEPIKSEPQDSEFSEDAVESEKNPLESKMSEALNSAEYLQALEKFPNNVRERIIGDTVQYLILFQGESEKLPEYMKGLQEVAPLLSELNGEGLFEDAKVNVLLRSVAEKLHIQSWQDTESKEKIYSYFRENYIEKGYSFHGFNGAFEQLIRTHGLDPEMRTWNWDDLNHVRDIFTKAGWRMALGWSIYDKGKFSIADEAKNMYRYAVASPEWFAQFVAEGYHVPNEEPYDKKAFYRRDYAAAKKNVELACDALMSRSEEDIRQGKTYPNITQGEREDIMKFFEKYWQLLGSESSKPKLALIKKEAINLSQYTFDSYADFSETMERRSSYHYSFEDAISAILDPVSIDGKYNRTISPKDILIIDMPDYTKVHNAP